MGHPHLRRAPIVEALVDLKVSPPAGGLDAIEPFAALISLDFPNRQRLAHLSANLRISETDAAPEFAPGTSQVLGSIFTASDSSKAVQSRIDGFSFSQLGKYDDWATLRRNARGYWDQYVSTVHPMNVSRWALRFINRIELPLPMRDFGDYLRTMPVISPDLPQGLSEFFLRLVVPFPSATVVVSQTIDAAGVTPESIPIILDIDVFESGELPASGEEIWERLDRLREIKNDVFFKSITETTWRMYE